MRRRVDADSLGEFLSALGRVDAPPATAYLVGGGTAVLHGWRPTTIDVDLRLEPEHDELLRAVARLKEELEINVEFASPLDFLPELPGWRDRSPYIAQHGSLTVRHLDLYSQALAKLERGFDQDLADVTAMVARGLIDAGELDRLFAAVADQLYRFPTVDRGRLQAAVAGLKEAE